MTTAYWCILVAAILPYPIAMLAKAQAGYDNAAPREHLSRAEGYRKRANWAQLNAFEAFPPFAAGVIIAQLQHVPQSTVDVLALAFIALRLMHAMFYIANKPTLRSLVWTLGFACVIGLFVTAGIA
jgi:uncharacterized MAPEG superfamily protein